MTPCGRFRNVWCGLLVDHLYGSDLDWVREGRLRGALRSGNMSARRTGVWAPREAGGSFEAGPGDLMRAGIGIWVSSNLMVAATLIPLLPAPEREPNYDETQVPAYVLPDPLVTEDGRQIKTAQDWRKIRRPEILELFRLPDVRAASRTAPGTEVPGHLCGFSCTRRHSRPQRGFALLQPGRRPSPDGSPDLPAGVGLRSGPGLSGSQLQREPFHPAGPGHHSAQNLDAPFQGGRRGGGEPGHGEGPRNIVPPLAGGKDPQAAVTPW